MNVNRTKACAYLRMSTDRQDTSIEIQKKRLEEMAEREGYEIIEWFKDEGRSASKDTKKRVDWLRMLASASKAQWQVILCYNRSRFSRLDSIEEAQAKQALRTAGKSLHTLFEGKFDWNTSTGRIIDVVHTEASNGYSVNLGRGTLEGRVNAFINGKGHGQICPYGMARVLTNPHGVTDHIKRGDKSTRPKGWSQVFVPGEPGEVEAVNWIFNTFNEQDVGYRWLARTLNAKGIPAPDGGKWRGSVVFNLLQNVTYVGDLSLGKRTGGAFARLEGLEVVPTPHGKRPERRKGIVLQNTHEGIIDRVLFQKVQEKIKRKSKQRTRAGGERGFALKDIMRCGHCGGALFGRRDTGKKSSGRVAYFCRSAEYFGREAGCMGWHVDERDILPFVIDKLTAAVNVKLLEASSVKPPPDERPEGKNEVASLERRIAAWNRKIEEGHERLLVVSVEHMRALDAMLTTWKAERAELMTQLARARVEQPTLKTLLEEWKEWLASVKEHLVEVQTSPPEGAKLEPGLKFTPAAFREALKRHGCRVTCWWMKVGVNRWLVERVRIQLGGEGPSGGGEQPGGGDEGPSGGGGDGPSGENSPNSGETAGSGGVPEGAIASAIAPSGTAPEPVIDLIFTGKDLYPNAQSYNALPAMLELRAKGMTYEAIAASLNEKGIKTGSGVSWTWRNVVRVFRSLPPDQANS